MNKIENRKTKKQKKTRKKKKNEPLQAKQPQMGLAHTRRGGVGV
jgi:hypothetical protein